MLKYSFKSPVVPCPVLKETDSISNWETAVSFIRKDVFVGNTVLERLVVESSHVSMLALRL